MMTGFPRFILVGLGAALLSLPGCSQEFLDTTALGIFHEEDVNLTQHNYAAADFLIQQASTFISGNAVTKAAALTNAQEPEMHSKIASIIPEQVGIRLSQLGYHMDLTDVASGTDTQYLGPPPGRENTPPDFILSGSYTRGRTEMDVNLRIVDIKKNRIVASFDYKLPMNRTIGELSEPQARIYKVSH